MDRNDRMVVIRQKCKDHGCNDKVAKIHFAQYVDRQWNPHPPKRFKDWWETSGVKFTEKKTGRQWSVPVEDSDRWIGIDTVKAFNCQAVQDCYTEAKQVGLA